MEVFLLNIKDACELIKSEHFEPLVSRGMLTPAKHGGFCCTAPGCSNGTGKDATGNKPFLHNGHWIHKCFVCGDSANNLDIIARHYNLNLDDKQDFIETVRIGCSIFNISLDNNFSNFSPKKKISSYKLLSSISPFVLKPRKFLPPQITTGETELHFPSRNIVDSINSAFLKQELELIRSDIFTAQENLSALPVENRRGLSQKTLRHFHCGFLENWIHPKIRVRGHTAPPSRRLIIPTAGNTHYLACALDRDKIDKSFWKMHAGTKKPFNVENISPNKLTIVTEGEIDAMSIHQAIHNEDIVVVATGGATNFSSFIDFLKNNYSSDENFHFLILFDSDDTGRLNAPKFATELVDLGFSSTYNFLSDDNSKIDANDILNQENGENLLADKISALIYQADFDSVSLPQQSQNNIQNLISFADYFSGEFQFDIDLMTKYSKRTTGFSNIDVHQIFSPGLYVVGGLAALGKTSFCWQLLHQLAANGEFCIYCSYEMSRLELFSKSLAAELFRREPTTCISSADIRRGAFSNAIQKIICDFQASSLDLCVLDLQDESIDTFLAILERLSAPLGKSPVVCLDYLQIVPNYISNTKTSIDDTVRKLKAFQRATNTTFIVISSFNRQNYSQPVSFESFKESGNIEYSADVVWGLQLYCTKFLRDGATSKNREIIEQAKKANPRQIQLSCLKNRQGYNYDAFFKYFPAHDIFIPCEESDFANKFERSLNNAKF